MGVGVTEGRLRLPALGPWPRGYMARCVGFSKGFAEPVRRRELPSRNVTVIISFGDPLVLVGPADKANRSVSSFVSGLQSESALTERLGHQYGIHVELTPLAAHALFGQPMHELTDTLVDLAAVLGRDTGQLIERLAGAANWPDRFASLRAVLAERISSGPQPTAAVASAWHRLRATNGSVRIEQLVKESGCSNRYLAARFREEIGMTPKALARVLRFEHSLDLLRHTEASFADVASAAGYYDQAHFNRDVRALAGCAPGALLLGDRSVTADLPRSDFSKTA